MTPKQFIYLVRYSIRTIFTDIFDALLLIRNPRTWSYIFFLLSAIGAYYKNVKLVAIALIMTISVKILRDHIEGKYRREMFEREVLRDNKDGEIVIEYYESYLRKCTATNVQPLSLLDYMNEEKERIIKKRIDSDIHDG